MEIGPGNCPAITRESDRIETAEYWLVRYFCFVQYFSHVSNGHSRVAKLPNNLLIKAKVV
jgi:hypothetical protein